MLSGAGLREAIHEVSGDCKLELAKAKDALILEGYVSSGGLVVTGLDKSLHQDLLRCFFCGALGKDLLILWGNNGLGDARGHARYMEGNMPETGVVSVYGQSMEVAEMEALGERLPQECSWRQAPCLSCRLLVSKGEDKG